MTSEPSPNIPDPRMHQAITEIEGLIISRYPGTTFAVTRSDDPPGIRVLATVDVDDIEEVLDLYIHRLTQLQVEEGRYPIPELARLAERQPEVEVRTADPDGRATIVAGEVRCRAFPFVVLTSNGERDFPPPFLRRCLQLELHPPDPPKLDRIVEAQLGPQLRQEAEDLITEFVRRRERYILATDQLLNAVYLLVSGAGADPGDRQELLDVLLHSLGEKGVA